ncbi:amino acid transporter-like protein [Xylogone sp. PMI_703]|nr:amino acid transporter-like protein [Xylogone sp. PMI_703]
MAAVPVNIAADGGDPRMPDPEKFGLAETTATSGYIRPQHRPRYDPTVTFEEYQYYAKETRAEEDLLEAKNPSDKGIKAILFPSKNTKGDVIHGSPVVESGGEETDKNKNIHDRSHHDRVAVTDDEWANASRALRTASWSAVFYLITTDILGPFNAPFAMSSLGWGPGLALYTVFGGLAIYSGFLIYWMFLGLDSHGYPMRCYADMAYRLYGPLVRHLFNILQSIQLLFNVGIIIIGNGQALSQVSKFNLCYAVCCLVFAIAGFGLGQVRTLQKYGWVANLAVWLNVFIIIETMAVAAHSKPNFVAVGASAGTALGGLTTTPDPVTGAFPPVTTSGGIPPSTTGFVGAVNGLSQAVYAYGGAMLFVEFMAEMRRPRDFWKGALGAQIFIYLVYVFYGCFMYGYQGQYTINPSYQGISPYAWQTVGNVIAFLSALIAAGLYGNIGIKVLYNNIFMEFLGAPPLTATTGKFLWAAIVPVYWSLAYIVSAAIPDFGGLTSLVGAVCILQFTYTFPPILYVGFKIKSCAMLPGDGFDPATGNVIRQDNGVKRWIRGFFADKWWLNAFNVIYFLGALVTCGLGAYSAIENLIATFKEPQHTAFTCHSPVQS